MSDTVSKEQRSKNMALIRSRGNKTTELAFASLLRKLKISGWRRHAKAIDGRPDFIFPASKIAVFVDGCFWHGCKRCGALPKSNKKYWGPKIDRNIRRDRTINRSLRSQGWRAVRIWEHEITKDGARKGISLIISTQKRRSRKAPPLLHSSIV